ncbi:zinc ribbon domain-containing protein [Haloplanus aerogenes]|uniref:Zinc ribbon domain-containing protein n=1 Tax=Haloplanus aerogenes TaxID=660522 RepID=A0A3G8QS32_9EURY|nr:zinc ribbon domain-containing protein [Haloplanus aerogenes]AZH24229.1 zinc ribbon domain-containing protein [Haloplanus aerogenes]
MSLSLAFAALVVVPLAQVPLVMFLSRFVELDPDERRPEAARGYVTYGTVSAHPEPTGRPVCPHCGTAVDDAYDYCGACAGRLPPPRARR